MSYYLTKKVHALYKRSMYLYNEIEIKYNYYNNHN